MRLRWCLVNDDDVGDGDVENSSLNSQTKRKRKVSLHVKSGDDNGEQASDSKRTFVDFLGWEKNYQNWVFWSQQFDSSTPYNEYCDRVKRTKGLNLADSFEGKGTAFRVKKSRQNDAAKIVAHVMMAYGVDVKVASQYLGQFQGSHVLSSWECNKETFDREFEKCCFIWSHQGIFRRAMLHSER